MMIKAAVLKDSTAPFDTDAAITIITSYSHQFLLLLSLLPLLLGHDT